RAACRPTRRAGRRAAQPDQVAGHRRGVTGTSIGSKTMRIGVLTGGGDCPGLNAVIRAVVRKGVGVYGHEFLGFRDGWKGPLEGETMTLGIDQVRGILPRGGTILGSSRTNPFKIDGGVERIKANLESLGL